MKDEKNASRNICRGRFHSAEETQPEPAVPVSFVPKSFHIERTEPLSGLCVKSFSATDDTEKIFAAE
jgi:hypothetical protein